MGLYKLLRQKQGSSTLFPSDPKNAVRGKIVDAEYNTLAATLENADVVIPAGLYKIQVNISPKFKTFMPLITNVPGRWGIRIHFGTKPSHSQGCVLITNKKTYQNFVKKLLYEQENCEPIYFEIINA